MVLVGDQDQYLMGFVVPSGYSYCCITQPDWITRASISSVMQTVVLGSVRSDGDTNAFLSKFTNCNLSLLSSSKAAGCSFCILTFNGAARHAKLLSNLWNTSHNPGRERGLLTFVCSFDSREVSAV